MLLRTLFVCGMLSSGIAFGICEKLPSYEKLERELTNVINLESPEEQVGIFVPHKLWLSVVDRDGTICAVIKHGDAWPGSRIISAQKAFTANAFSNDELALSTANLYSAVQPGGTLYGLQHSNPIRTEIAYQGKPRLFGTFRDPLIGMVLGGINVFGGGLALYDINGKVIGGLGISGDTSCTDHIVAWRLRKKLGLNNIPKGVHPNGSDHMILDLGGDIQVPSGFGHPSCGPDADRVIKQLKPD